MINVHWVLLGSALGTIGLATYVRDTLRGRNQPNRMTWLLWGVIPLIAFAAEHRDGVGLESLLTFTAGFGPLVVLGATFVNRASVWRIGTLDYVCAALSATAVVVWLTTGRGDVAIAGSILADLLAGVPTLVKSWKVPDTESPGAYLGAVVSSAVTLLTVTHWNADQAAFPLYLACVGSIELLLVAGRIGPRRRRERSAGA